MSGNCLYWSVTHKIVRCHKARSGSQDNFGNAVLSFQYCLLHVLCASSRLCPYPSMISVFSLLLDPVLHA